MGGYVAENYFALERLSSWFYSPIILIAPSPTEVGGNAENVVHVIRALQVMMSRLVSRTIDDEKIRDYKRHIHIFLSSFSKFDTDVQGEHKQTWVRSYNFMSLLNLPSVLKSTTVPYGTFGREGVKENESSVLSILCGVFIGKTGCQICLIGYFVRWQLNG